MLSEDECMSHDIGKIGTVTEKSFNKPEQFDQKQSEKEAKAKEGSGVFDELVKDQNVPLKNENKTTLDGSDVQLKEAPSNIGDKILGVFQGMKGNIDTQHQKVDKLLNSDEVLSMKDMFKTQKAITNLTLTQDLMSKIVGKSTQSLETLMKQQ